MSAHNKSRNAKVIDLAIGSYRPHGRIETIQGIIAANFLQGEDFRQKSLLRIPTHTDFYKHPKSIQGITAYSFNKVLKEFISKKYITKTKGYSWWGESYPNVYSMTKLGREFFSLLGPFKIGHSIFVKRGEERFKLKSSKFKKQNNFLKKYSRYINDSGVSFRDTNNIQISIFRVFNTKSSLGGRFFHKIQSLKKKERKHLAVGNKRLVEWDIESCQLQIICALHKIKYKKIVVPKSLVYLKRLYKMASLVMTNCSSFNAAVWVLSEEIRFSEDWAHGISKNKIIEIRRESLKISNAIVLDIFHQLKYMRHLLFKKMSLNIQHSESELCLDMLKDCFKYKIPMIPIHDAYLVPENHSKDLAELFKKVSFKHFGVKLILNEH